MKNSQKATYGPDERNEHSRELYGSTPQLFEFTFFGVVDNLVLFLDDGSVRVWKNITTSEKKREDLVTAWQVLPEVSPSPKSAGMVFSWEPASQHLVAGGDAKLLRVWSLDAETKVVDIQTRLEVGVTSVCSEASASGIFAAGYANGSVRLYDRRCSPSEAQVMIFDGHSAAVVSMKMPANMLFHKVYSASFDGDVKLWDARLPNPISVTRTTPGMTSMDVHQRAEIFCW